MNWSVVMKEQRYLQERSVAGHSFDLLQTFFICRKREFIVALILRYSLCFLSLLNCKRCVLISGWILWYSFKYSFIAKLLFFAYLLPIWSSDHLIDVDVVKEFSHTDDEQVWRIFLRLLGLSHIFYSLLVHLRFVRWKGYAFTNLMNELTNQEMLSWMN